MGAFAACKNDKTKEQFKEYFKGGLFKTDYRNRWQFRSIFQKKKENSRRRLQSPLPAVSAPGCAALAPPDEGFSIAHAGMLLLLVIGLYLFCLRRRQRRSPGYYRRDSGLLGLHDRGDAA